MWIGHAGTCRDSLRDDSLKFVLARQLENLRAALVDVIDVADPRLDTGHHVEQHWRRVPQSLFASAPQSTGLAVGRAVDEEPEVTKVIRERRLGQSGFFV